MNNDEYNQGYRSGAGSTMDQEAGARAAERERAESERQYQEDMRRANQYAAEAAAQPTSYPSDERVKEKPTSQTKKSTVNNTTTEIKSPNETIGGISVFLAIVMGLIAYNDPQSELAIIPSVIVTFLASYVILYICYYAIIIAVKVIEIVMTILVWAAIITAVAYAADAEWAARLINSINFS